jgi:hypothetical protein
MTAQPGIFHVKIASDRMNVNDGRFGRSIPLDLGRKAISAGRKAEGRCQNFGTMKCPSEARVED